MIHDVLPAEVVAVEVFADPDDVRLFDAERAVVAGAVARRRQEFATVRHCARIALAQLGYSPAPLLPGQRGAPQWPPGVVGSMTHCAGYRAAAVAPSARMTAIGIDAEPDEPLPAGVLDAIARPEEVEHLARLATTCPVGPASGSPTSWERLLFCCKEAVFKTWYPVTGRELGFDQASIRFRPAERTRVADLLIQPATAALPRTLVGRWTIGHGLVVCAISIPAVTTPA